MRFLKCILYFIVFISCQREIKTINEMYAYLKDPANELTKEFVKFDYKITITYKPAILMAARELSNVKNPVSKDSILNYYLQKEYFTLSIQYKDGEFINKLIGNIDYYDKVKDLIYNISPRIVMFVNNDTINPIACIYSDVFGYMKSTDFVLVFPSIKNSKDDIIKIYLNGTDYGFGYVNFSFKRKSINKIPNLII